MDKKYRELMAGYVDEELTEDERQTLEAELARNPDLRAELAEFRRLKEITGMMHYADLPDEVWEGYWQNLYRKLERGIGWVLFSIGSIILLGFGLYHGLSAMYLDPEIPLWLKIGVTTLGSGGIFLLVSFIRERLFAYKRDRYREVNK